jgi:hypothetical protein
MKTRLFSFWFGPITTNPPFTIFFKNLVPQAGEAATAEKRSAKNRNKHAKRLAKEVR